jgi:hypothetical protein
MVLSIEQAQGLMTVVVVIDYNVPLLNWVVVRKAPSRLDASTTNG